MKKNRYPIRHAWTLIATATLAATTACRQAPPPTIQVTTDSWSRDGVTGRTFVTDHFVVETTLADEGFTEILPLFLEALYQRFTTDVPAMTEHPRMTVYLFATRQQWNTFTQQTFADIAPLVNKINRGGYTRGNVAALYMLDRADTVSILAHEAWHLYENTCLPNAMPSWLSEGLACAYEGAGFVNRKLLLNPTENPLRRNDLRDAARQQRLQPIARIVDTRADDLIDLENSLSTGLFYAQTWALVTFLRGGPDETCREQWNNMIADASAGTLATTVAERQPGGADMPRASMGRRVFDAYFQVAPESLDQAFYEHVLKLCDYR